MEIRKNCRSHLESTQTSPFLPRCCATTTFSSTILGANSPSAKQPGTIHFLGASGKVQINAENGLIDIPSRIENKKYDLTLDLSGGISFLPPDIFNALATAHADWPNIVGAVGPANGGERADETKASAHATGSRAIRPAFSDQRPRGRGRKRRKDASFKNARYQRSDRRRSSCSTTASGSTMHTRWSTSTLAGWRICRTSMLSA